MLRRMCRRKYSEHWVQSAHIESLLINASCSIHSACQHACSSEMCASHADLESQRAPDHIIPWAERRISIAPQRLRQISFRPVG